MKKIYQVLGSFASEDKFFSTRKKAERYAQEQALSIMAYNLRITKKTLQGILDKKIPMPKSVADFDLMATYTLKNLRDDVRAERGLIKIETINVY